MSAAPTRTWKPRPLWIILAIGLLLVSGLTALGPSRAGPVPVSVATHVNPVQAQHPAAASRPALTVSPLEFGNNSTAGQLPSSDWYCTLAFAFYDYCYDQSQEPTLLNLPNGQLGLGFSAITGYNTTNFTTCPLASPTVVRAAFESSSNNGSTFSSPVFLPTPTGHCDYVQQMEPSFALVGTTLWGAYVSSNVSASSMFTGTGPPVEDYSVRTSDAIAIANSTTNGTSFGSARFVVSGANFANPRLASFGNTLYLLYENISNGSSYLPNSPSANPISERWMYSADNGATWHGPYYLPGENASQFYNTMGGSVSVNSAGTVAVAYATNRSCIAYCSFGSYSANGEDVVVATSTTNGTSWSPIRTVAKAQGQITGGSTSYCTQWGPAGTEMCGFFENAPATTVAWGSSGDLYVAWSATVHQNVTALPAYFYDYQRTEIFAGSSSGTLATWQYSQVTPPVSTLANFQGTFANEWFTPAIGVHAGEAYLTYSYWNWAQQCGYQSFGSALTTNTFSQWYSTSTNGFNYTAPAMLFLSTRSDGLSYYHDSGVVGSVAFTKSGAPLFAYADPDGWFLQTPVRPFAFQYAVSLSVSYPWSGPTTNLTVDQSGLAPTAPWTFAFNGFPETSNQSSVTVSGVPVGKLLTLSWPGPAMSTGYRSVLEPVLSGPSFLTLSGPLTVWYNFTTFYGISIAPQPNDFYFGLQFDNYGTIMNFQYYFNWDTYASPFGSTLYYYADGCAMPWYFPSGTRLDLRPAFSYPVDSSYYTESFIGYWNGTGAGSFTGPGNSANLTVSSPFNESAWDLPSSDYSVPFTPVGLPASSTYSFDLDGVLHSAAGTTPTIVSNLTTGSHIIGNISATSTKTGWQYFGQSSVGSAVLVPIDPADNLTFAFVNTSASVGTVSFHAIGVTPGSAWQLMFNGTEYSSNTPWINVSTKPGSFVVNASNVVSADGTAALVPSGFGPVQNVTTGQTYSINFTGTYRLRVLGSAGGIITPSGGTFWEPKGASKNLTAAPLPGYFFGGWAGTGNGSYTGLNLSASVTVNSPVEESAGFVPLNPNRFNMTVNESGVPAGTNWSVLLNGNGYASNQRSLRIGNLYSCLVSGSLGNYNLVEPTVGGAAGVRYVPAANNPTTGCVVQNIQLNFSEQFSVGVTGTPGGTISGVDFGNLSWVDFGSSITLQASTNPGYRFLGWIGTGSGSSNSTASTITIFPGGPVEEQAEWAPIPPAIPQKYPVTFNAEGLPAGTPWSVQFNGSAYASTGGPITVPAVLNNSYSYQVSTVSGLSGAARYVPSPPGPTVAVHGGPVNVSIPFAASYWLSVTSVGPGTASPSSGWVVAGKTIILNASPTGNALFEGWTGVGNDSYSGPDFGPSVRVEAPINEVATFVTPAPPATTSGSSGGGATVELEAGLAIAGLAIGLVVGVVLARRGRPPAEMSSPEGA